VSDRSKDDTRLLDLIRHSYATSHGVYGARRVFGDLREANESCGLHRVERLMQRHKIKALRGYKKPRAIAGRPSIIAPYHLQREFTVDAPNKVWVTDITYIRTWQGWLYLAAVLDLYARKVVVVHEGHAGQGTGARRFADGGLVPQASAARPGPQRPGQPIWKR
jgi:putative transposase